MVYALVSTFSKTGKTENTDVDESAPGMRIRSSSRTSSGESVRWTRGHDVAEADDASAADVDDDSGEGSGCGKENMSRNTAERLAKIPL